MKKPLHLTSLALAIITAGTLLTNCASDQAKSEFDVNANNSTKKQSSDQTDSNQVKKSENNTIAPQPSNYPTRMIEEQESAEIQIVQSQIESYSQKATQDVMYDGAMPANKIMASPVLIKEQHDYLDYDDRQANITIAENPEQKIKLTRDEPVSTFSVDIDTASFSQIKQYLDMGQLPPKALVRTEEIINYFDYQYPTAKNIDNPIKLNANLMAHPFKENTHLLQLGLKAFEVEKSQLPPMNLVLLIDVSGSMSSQNKLPLLIKAMDVLIDQLDEEDRVSIVTYAGRAAVLAQGVKGSEKTKLHNIINSLNSGGSTHGSAGIEQAYNLAQEFHIEDGVNRVVLATDGDFNVGLTGTDSLKEFVSKKANDKVYLSAIGFGHSGYNDAIMEEISNAGEGSAYFINDYNQARKVFSKDLPSMALSVAADVKVQVEFNPDYVSEYRLIGYNNRRLNREDFNNDKIDAAEMGAGHNVTAIYEVTLANDTPKVDPLRYQENPKPMLLIEDPTAEIAFFKARYKSALDQKSEKISLPIYNNSVEKLSTSLKLASAAMQFGETLRDEFATKDDYQSILNVLETISNPNNEVAELINMIHNAKSLTKQ